MNGQNALAFYFLSSPEQQFAAIAHFLNMMPHEVSHIATEDLCNDMATKMVTAFNHDDVDYHEALESCIHTNNWELVEAMCLNAFVEYTLPTMR